MSDNQYKHIQFKCDEHIAHIVIDNPKTLNGLDVNTIIEMMDAFMFCEKNGDIKAVILSGAGKAFSGGGDVSSFYRDAKAGTTNVRPLARVLCDITLQMKKCPKPIIAAVHGAAAGGGCNIALAADIVLAADNAKFVQAFIKIGLIPDTGGPFWLPRIIGTARAFEMFSTGRHVTADEAYQIGMITEVCSKDKLMDRAMEYANKYVNGPSVGYANIKKLMFESLYKDFESYSRAEVDCQVECSETEDYVEGVSAFIEKRKVEFKGK